MPTTTETMPTGEELDALWNRLADAAEELHKEFRRVCRVVNGPEPVPVTFADVGMLVNFIVNTRRLCVEQMGDFLDSLEHLVNYDLIGVAHEKGERASVPQYDEHGRPNYPGIPDA